MYDQSCPLRSKLEDLAAFNYGKRRSIQVSNAVKELGLGLLFLASYVPFTPAILRPVST